MSPELIATLKDAPELDVFAYLTARLPADAPKRIIGLTVRTKDGGKQTIWNGDLRPPKSDCSISPHDRAARKLDK